MPRTQLIEMLRSLVDHGTAGTLDQAESVVEIPASTYTDPGMFALEKERIFKRLPLMVAPSCELPQPGDFKAIDIAGVPLLVTRKADGSVAAMLNMCTHRGNPVASGTGNSSRFVCNYHGWTFKNDGALIGVASSQDFGEIDKAANCLTQFPVYESAGLIWVILDPKSQLNIADYLCGYDDLLNNFGFADFYLFDQRTLSGPNWKTAYDGYLDFYHLPVLHKDTFGDTFGNRAHYFQWGPHQRVAGPSKFFVRGPDDMVDLSQQAESEWSNDALMSGVWTIFPHVSIASFFSDGVRGALISQLFPGNSVGESVTTQYYVMERKPETDAAIEAAKGQCDFLEAVVRDEDYVTGKRQHQALQSGLLKNVLFGRNERGGQLFHQWLAKLVDASDAELAEIFSKRDLLVAAE
jgi:carnitine monooxygenase subunit